MYPGPAIGTATPVVAVASTLGTEGEAHNLRSVMAPASRFLRKSFVFLLASLSFHSCALN